jgi:hypothetical protein
VTLLEAPNTIDRVDVPIISGFEHRSPYESIVSHVRSYATRAYTLMPSAASYPLTKLPDYEKYILHDWSGQMEPGIKAAGV